MTLPFALPEWLPWWAALVVCAVALIYGLVFAVMPFSVFGLRGRLDAIDARIDALHGEIRTLVLRLPENPDEIDYHLPPAPRQVAASRPPIPPASPYAAAPRSTGGPMSSEAPYSYEAPPAPPPDASPAPPPRTVGRPVEPTRAWRQSVDYGVSPPPPPPPAPRTLRVDRPIGGWDDTRRRPSEAPAMFGQRGEPRPSPPAEPKAERRVEPRLPRYDGFHPDFPRDVSPRDDRR